LTKWKIFLIFIVQTDPMAKQTSSIKAVGTVEKLNCYKEKGEYRHGQKQAWILNVISTMLPLPTPGPVPGALDGAVP
jgi:hypothetical protein